jgi:hypothetical protein
MDLKKQMVIRDDGLVGKMITITTDEIFLNCMRF